MMLKGNEEALKRINNFKTFNYTNSDVMWLDLSNLELTELSNLPSNVIHLYCNHNKLAELPNLSIIVPNLTHLFCFDNQLKELPVLPPTLQVLGYSYNKFKKIPNLPPILQTLYCSSNQL